MQELVLCKTFFNNFEYKFWLLKKFEEKFKNEVKIQQILKTPIYFLILELFAGIQYEEANQNKNNELASNLFTAI